ncbi:hypothetical protein NDU88_004383 [Pleurodeles waltl]|uniref:Uncharacterized protein n=1 Tax=Pleurodeles waltl TaxID=8319 RepID=A0AAV7TU25_PLEWA|nr:hypothetical protein NDU88_004383 [Pleurodeles waltl]
MPPYGKWPPQSKWVWPLALACLWSCWCEGDGKPCRGVRAGGDTDLGSPPVALYLLGRAAPLASGRDICLLRLRGGVGQSDWRVYQPAVGGLEGVPLNLPEGWRAPRLELRHRLEATRAENAVAIGKPAQTSDLEEGTEWGDREDDSLSGDHSEAESVASVDMTPQIADEIV